ncbi:MAG: FAD:protein FMN transferase [Candidatus Thiodiazotropha sp. (ex Notomyrtea botanica)]|nr:FAD:protein FMN transferase [Candidatus Thiodiazotropha sp. (ex Notomyrtea botanica)]
MKLRAGLLCAFLMALLLPFSSQGAWFGQQAAIMGTRIGVEVWHEDEQAANQAIESVLDEFRRLDQALSPYIETSELYLVNDKASYQPVTISKEFYGLLETSQTYSQLTDGAFDITFASAGHQYDYRKEIKPTDEALDQTRPLINYRHLTLDPDSQSVHFKQTGVRIDLGGIAKGYAVDRGIQLLEQLGIENALISAGGDSRMLGDHRGRPWHIGVQAPRDEKALAAVLPLSNSAISTSGDYERYFEANGVRYHHILSPKTGRSAGELRSVTIIGPNATRTDALSTSVFVLGLKDGLALINHQKDVEAVIIDSQGQMHASQGLENLKQSETIEVQPTHLGPVNINPIRPAGAVFVPSKAE